MSAKAFYEPSWAKFVSAHEPAHTGGAPQGASQDLSSLQQGVRDLKARLKKDSKSGGKQKQVPYKDRPITPEVIEEFLEEAGIAEWMHALVGLIKRAVESDILDDPGVAVADLWANAHDYPQGLFKEIWEVRKVMFQGSSCGSP